MLGVVHTRGKSLQSWLGDVQTYKITLALAYILCYLTTTQSQLQMKAKSLRWK